MSDFNSQDSTGQLSQPQFNYQDPNNNPLESEINNPGLADDLKHAFLKGVDQQDLPILQKYVGQWDNGYREKMAEVKGGYKWIDELGGQEFLTAAAQIAQEIDRDPLGIYQKMKEGLAQMFGDDFDAPQGPPEQDGGQQLQNNLPENQGMPEDWVNWRNNMQEALIALGQAYSNDRSAAQAAADNKVFDDKLAEMHTLHGKFDDDWVTLKIAQGRTPEEAVQLYQQFVSELQGSRKPIPPTIPTMSGGVQTGQANQGGKQFASAEARKAYVASMIDAANQA